tara:strand:+ start:141 stop:515 length:375 start_codon:yes stop_codon:yes gene_type:complete
MLPKLRTFSNYVLDRRSSTLELSIGKSKFQIYTGSGYSDEIEVFRVKGSKRFLILGINSPLEYISLLEVNIDEINFIGEYQLEKGIQGESLFVQDWRVEEYLGKKPESYSPLHVAKILSQWIGL